MNGFFYWTGVSVWASIALFLAWLAFELVIVGAVTSFSWHRWSIATSPKFNLREHWWSLVKSFFVEWWKFKGYRNNGRRSYTGACGAYWRGVGDWSRGI
jgi:hypothetical protein